MANMECGLWYARNLLSLSLPPPVGEERRNKWLACLASRLLFVCAKKWEKCLQRKSGDGWDGVLPSAIPAWTGLSINNSRIILDLLTPSPLPALGQLAYSVNPRNLPYFVHFSTKLSPLPPPLPTLNADVING